MSSGNGEADGIDLPHLKHVSPVEWEKCHSLRSISSRPHDCFGFEPPLSVYFYTNLGGTPLVSSHVDHTFRNDFFLTILFRPKSSR